MVRPLAALTVALFATAALAGPGKKEADRAINDLRSAKDAKGKAAALLEVGKIGQVQKALVASAEDDVVKCLEDKEAVVRAAAAECYGMLDPDPKEAVPALLKLLTGEDEDLRVRVGAAKGLGAIGSAAKAALPDLQKIQREYAKKQQDAAKGPKAEMDMRQMYGQMRTAAQAAVQSIQPRKK
jgi:HEAT repeat protein